MLTVHPNKYMYDIDYRESNDMTLLGGFLMTFKNQRRITINARLTEEEKAQGLAHMLEYLERVGDTQVIMYLWTADQETLSPLEH